MVFRNLDNKTKAYGTLVVFLAIAVLFWWVSDSFSIWSQNASPILALLVNIVLNPSYALLIYWLYREYDARGIFAGLLISVAIDIVSLTHSVSKMGVLPTDAPLYGYSDTTLYKIIYPIAHNQIAVFVLYVIIPTLLVYLALRIIRRTASFNRITKEAI